MARRRPRRYGRDPLGGGAAAGDETGELAFDTPASGAPEPGAGTAGDVEGEAVDEADVVAVEPVGRPAVRRERPAGGDRLQEARQLALAGSTAEAIELYRSLIRDEPRNLVARNALGQLYDRCGLPAQALEQYQAAREIDDDNVDILVNGAGAMAALNRYEPAERDLRRAVRLDPSRADAYTTLGMIYFRRGLYAQAEQELKRALELDPHSAAGYHYRGESLNQLGRVDEAMTMLDRAAQLQPDYARTYYVMGILFDKKGRPEEAAAMYRKAHEITAA